MKESKFQAALIKDIKKQYPGCVVLKNDEQYLQGFPDLTILFPNKQWAVLECKKSENEPFQPNQKHYIDTLSQTGFAKVIYPENKEEVLNELHQSFQPRRSTRVS